MYTEFIIGLRGVGKTAIVNKIRDLAEELNYRAVLIEAHEGKALAALLMPAPFMVRSNNAAVSYPSSTR